MASPPRPLSATLPRFDVRLTPPDITPWLAGNTGIRGFTAFESGRPGPNVMAVALTHGNELGGAIALDAMLRGGVAVARGSLTLGFANIDAFARFDPRNPTLSRFVDEDFNRLWSAEVMDGPRRSSELDRAREIRPLVDAADVLLDLHSMLWPSDPLLLCGPSDKGRALAVSIGAPGLVIADRGHLSGPRLIDYARFTDGSPAAACLVEAGQHWHPTTVGITEACLAGLLHATGLQPEPVPSGASPEPPRVAEVTVAVTALTNGFAFVQPFRGGDVIPERNTLIALDGTTEIRTPHDECLLVMPSLRPSRGHTAVRLARFL